jgi:UDP-N-acetylglucosamine:LPS N-acetylglucosamine transferase
MCCIGSGNRYTSTVDFTQVGPKDWKDEHSVEKLVQQVRDANIIITPDGIHHPRIIPPDGVHIHYEESSGYEDVLPWYSLNPKKATILLDAFNSAFKDMPEGDSKEQIRNFIIKNQTLIGKNSAKFDFSKSFILNLWDHEFNQRFLLFTKIVKEKFTLYNSVISDKKADAISVAILTNGGGHLSVAKSIAEALNKHESKKYNVKIIEVESLPGDNISFVTSGAVRTNEIYSRFRCQENNGAKADLYCQLRWELHQFIPDTTLFEAICEIKRFGTDIVLTTIQDEPHWGAPLADLGIPVWFFNTDYELPPQLEQLKLIANTDLLKILTPIDYSKGIKGIEPIGYPVRSGFQQEALDEEKIKLRKKYEVNEDEFLVVMQMGSLAMGIEREITALIEETRNLEKRCHFVFLCANNENAKKAIQKFQEEKNNDMITFHPLGMQDDTHLSLLYQASDAIIGKAGGATTAEIAATGAFLLAYKALPWEAPNLKYLRDRNQGVEIPDFTEINKHLNDKIKRNNKNQNKPIDWKQNLINKINSLF